MGEDGDSEIRERSCSSLFEEITKSLYTIYSILSNEFIRRQPWP